MSTKIKYWFGFAVICFLIIVLLVDYHRSHQVKILDTPPASIPEIRARIQDIDKSSGAVVAWNYFKNNYTTNLIGSHDIAHYIGAAIYDEKGLDGLKSCDTSFAFGCYHGLLEEMIVEKGINNLPEAVRVCQDLPFSTQITCYHGIGHGVLSHFKYNLSPSLTECDDLFSSNFQHYCYTGVFMENSLAGYKRTTLTNPLWPCNSVDDKYKEACFGYQMIPLSNLYSNDPVKIAQVCQKADKEEYIQSCIRGLAEMVTQQNISRPDQIVKICQSLDGNYSYNCQIDAAEEFVFQKQSYDLAKIDFCGPLLGDWKSQCLSKIDLQRNLQ